MVAKPQFTSPLHVTSVQVAGNVVNAGAGHLRTPVSLSRNGESQFGLAVGKEFGAAERQRHSWQRDGKNSGEEHNRAGRKARNRSDPSARRHLAAHRCDHTVGRSCLVPLQQC